jgi:hypothetical protein
MTRLTFPPDWFAAGLVTAESAADFARLAAADPSRPQRHWRWLAFRDYVEENGPLSAEVCRAAFRLGESEPDANLGTAMMCSVVYQRACPAEVIAEAAASDRPAVRRAASRRV